MWANVISMCKRYASLFGFQAHGIFSRCVQLIRARIVVTESILLRTKVSGEQQKSHGARVRSNIKYNVFAT